MVIAYSNKKYGATLNLEFFHVSFMIFFHLLFRHSRIKLYVRLSVRVISYKFLYPVPVRGALGRTPPLRLSKYLTPLKFWNHPNISTEPQQ